MLVAASGVEASAQTGIARGRVVDRDRAPVAEATVELESLGGESRKHATEANNTAE